MLGQNKDQKNNYILIYLFINNSLKIILFSTYLAPMGYDIIDL